MKHAATFVVQNLAIFITVAANLTSKRLVEDDYYVNYDYDSSNNSGETNEIKPPDSFILPNPETVDAKYAFDALPNVELPDDSLADSDLRDHDFIDNIMYVYYGSHGQYSGTYGREIITVGALGSLSAQTFAVFYVFYKQKLNASSAELICIFVYLMMTLFISNLSVLGAFGTKHSLRCTGMAIVLHYFHLLTATWIFLYSYYIFKCISRKSPRNFRFWFLMAYVLPAATVLVCFCTGPSSYESKKFCFISIEGMMKNFLLPMSFYIILTTVYALCGIRTVNIKLSKMDASSSDDSLKDEIENILTGKTFHHDHDSATEFDMEVTMLRECRTSMKNMCIFQTSFAVIWFILVLALENAAYSNSMPIMYCISACSMNWYMCTKWKALLPAVGYQSLSKDKSCESEKTVLNDPISADSIPLLVNVENSTELRELSKVEQISTISG